MTSYHYPRQLFPWRPVPSGKVPKTVRKDYPWRLPSGMNWQGKSTFPDGKPSGNGSCRFLPSGKSFPVGFSFPSGVSFPVVTVLSRKVWSFPVSYITVREGSNFPCHLQYRQGRFSFLCQSTTVRETSFLVSIKAHWTIQIMD